MGFTYRADGTRFGVRVDGRDVGISYPRLIEAKDAAKGLSLHWRRDVEVFERPSGRIVKRISPKPKVM